MVSGKKLFKEIFQGLAFLAFADAMIVMVTMLAIAQGENVQHVPFWDAQIRFVVSILT